MIILGIWDGTPASAAIIVDGRLVSSVAEERLSRKKNEYGYPFRAIKSVLDSADITGLMFTITSSSPLGSILLCKN